MLQQNQTKSHVVFREEPVHLREYAERKLRKSIPSNYINEICFLILLDIQGIHLHKTKEQKNWIQKPVYEQ